MSVLLFKFKNNATTAKMTVDIFIASNVNRVITDQTARVIAFNAKTKRVIEVDYVYKDVLMVTMILVQSIKSVDLAHGRVSLV